MAIAASIRKRYRTARMAGRDEQPTSLESPPTKPVSGSESTGLNRQKPALVQDRKSDSANHPDLDCPMSEWATFSA